MYATSPSFFSSLYAPHIIPFLCVFVYKNYFLLLNHHYNKQHCTAQELTFLFKKWTESIYAMNQSWDQVFNWINILFFSCLFIFFFTATGLMKIYVLTTNKQTVWWTDIWLSLWMFVPNRNVDINFQLSFVQELWIKIDLKTLKDLLWQWTAN